MNKQRHPVFLIFIMIFSFSLVFTGPVSANDAGASDYESKIDTFLNKKFNADEPGTAVLAIKDGKVIYRKAVGMANMELEVKLDPGMVFRIGSITKQFTAAAIMKLVEEGKIKLDDSITKFLPEFPTNDTVITVHQLLNHTSGIKSYTGMKSFFEIMRKDMKVQEIIDLSKNEERDFKPGEKFLYNNSGYIILGAIIEKVSGKNYEEFIQEQFFTPLGMKNSYYGSNARIIPNRAAGYRATKEGYLNSRYLSMSLPYAAGSLLSTVDDLWTWTNALHAGKVVSLESFEKMITPTKTTDGETTEYGYGLSFRPTGGFKQIGHGGGINGFLTQITYLPEKKVFVAVLNNRLGGTSPSYAAQWIALLLAGKEIKIREAAELDDKTLDKIVGFYKIGDKGIRTITREGKQLFSQWKDGGKIKLFATKDMEFFFDEYHFHFTFERTKSGKVKKMIKHKLNGEKEIAIKIKKKPKENKKKENKKKEKK
jgi:CubicO group peptidase (beta-lactamase class C family)